MDNPQYGHLVYALLLKAEGYRLEDERIVWVLHAVFHSSKAHTASSFQRASMLALNRLFKPSQAW